MSSPAPLRPEPHPEHDRPWDETQPLASQDARDSAWRTILGRERGGRDFPPHGQAPLAPDVTLRTLHVKFRRTEPAFSQETPLARIPFPPGTHAALSTRWGAPFALSLCAHLVFFVAIYAASHWKPSADDALFTPPSVPETAIEVFGVTNVLQSQIREPELTPPPGVEADGRDQEATKTDQLLPQMPKDWQVEEAAAPADTDGVPTLPETTKTPTPTPTSVAATPRPTPAPSAVVVENPTQKPNTKTIAADELQKRVERETRKVDKTEQAGTHSTPGTGKKPDSALKDIPQSPFDSRIPDAPPALAGQQATGNLRGSALASATDSYGAAVQRALKRVWNLGKFAKYDPNLEVQVQVVVSKSGQILKATIAKSSGDKRFDQEPLDVLKGMIQLVEFPEELKGYASLPILLHFAPGEVK